MAKKTFGILSIVFFLAGLTSITFAQTHSGTIKGKIIDKEGIPLPDATIYLSSPSLTGIRTYFTSETGFIVFPGLPPGLYRIMVEKPGFKTVTIDNIIVRVGKTVHLDIPTETSPAEEEITRKIRAPVLDVVSPKIATSIDKDLLRHIPFPRNLANIIGSTPGVVTERVPFQKQSFIHGQSAKANTFAFDGMTMNNPSDRQPFINFNMDSIEEIEMATAAHSAEVALTNGGFINVVPKAGGNKIDGELYLYHTSEKISSLLRSKDELEGAGISPPALDKRLGDLSFSLGGLIFENMLWFFGNARVISQKRTTPFIPWTDPLGTEHRQLNRSNEEKMGFFKMTGRFIPELKVTGMFSYSDRYRSIYEPSVYWNTPEESTRKLEHEKNYTAHGILSYSTNQNTLAYAKVGYTSHKRPLRLDDIGNGKPQYFDVITERFWGSAGFNETRTQNRFQTTAFITNFKDNFLGGVHELKAGAEYEYISRESSVWKADNLSIDYYDGEPNYFGQDISPSSSLLVNKGKISFSIAGTNEYTDNPRDVRRRLSLFMQDSAVLFGRLSILLGFRFDRSETELFAHRKIGSGNDVSYSIGENILQPLSEVNPFGANSIDAWRNMLVWNALSPRIGLGFDIFGNGKFLFKASFSRYSEPLLLDYISDLNPFDPYRSHQFIWFDENMDGEVDDSDTYVPYPEDYRLYDPDYYRQRVAPKIRSPYTDEFTVGLHHELFEDFSIRVNYIHKTQKNILAYVMYDPDLDKDWYTIDQDTENWWIPFETIVPGIDDYPDSRITAYYRSNNAPLLFSRLKNVPELERKHQALEIAFKKRMSNNWQLNGSLVLSKATGNTGPYYYTSSEFSTALSPNYFVNLPQDSTVDFDVPLSIKLMGTYKFPLGFFLSFNFNYMNGIPWTRTVTIIPPSSWVQANNADPTPVSVFLEKPGERRTESFSNLDLRIEKGFKVGRAGSFSLSADILNVFGYKSDFTFQNDGGFWYPDAENTNQGRRDRSLTYKNITALLGTRTLRISLRLNF